MPIAQERVRTLLEAGTVKATRHLAVEASISLKDADNCMCLDTIDEAVFYLESIGVLIDRSHIISI